MAMTRAARPAQRGPKALPFPRPEADNAAMTADSAPATASPPRPAGGRLVDDLLRAAAAAPSMHNIQPWLFRTRDAGWTIELHADPERMAALPAGDPRGRAAHIACGAALLNLRVAAAVAGLEPGIRLLPDPGQPLLLAEIRMAGRHRATLWERELFAAIYQRQANREPFSGRPVPPGIRAELAGAADIEGAILHVLDNGEAARVLHLAASAERDLLANPAYRAELDRWTGGQRDQDGIPSAAFGARSPDGDTPVRDFDPARRNVPRYAWFEQHPQLAVLSVRSDGPAGWLAAGQALQRVWLTATCRGLSACPLTQPLETTDAWLVRDLRSGTEFPQMILRIGYGLPGPPRTPRRPVAEILLGRPAPA